MLETISDNNQEALVRTRVLAADYYINEEILSKEKKQLFFKTWQYACHAKEVPSLGDYTTFSLFDQKIFLIRTKQNEIKGYYNICNRAPSFTLFDERLSSNDRT